MRSVGDHLWQLVAVSAFLPRAILLAQGLFSWLWLLACNAAVVVGPVLEVKVLLATATPRRQLLVAVPLGLFVSGVAAVSALAAAERACVILLGRLGQMRILPGLLRWFFVFSDIREVSVGLRRRLCTGEGPRMGWLLVSFGGRLPHTVLHVADHTRARR